MFLLICKVDVVYIRRPAIAKICYMQKHTYAKYANVMCTWVIWTFTPTKRKGCLTLISFGTELACAPYRHTWGRMQSRPLMITIVDGHQLTRLFRRERTQTPSYLLDTPLSWRNPILHFAPTLHLIVSTRSHVNYKHVPSQLIKGHLPWEYICWVKILIMYSNLVLLTITH